MRRWPALAARILDACGLLIVAVAIALAIAPTIAADAAPVPTPYPQVEPGRVFTFPADFGSHPRYRTEWWYITGWLDTSEGEHLGFQITFFRARPTAADDNPSEFAARQLIIAHCAISDPRRGRLWQDQRIRRAGLGLADAATDDTRVHIGDWTLTRTAAGIYQSSISGEEFSLVLDFTPTQAVLLNGDGGFSRKGPEANSASYYYSLPHLRTRGSVTRKGVKVEATGEAWFDHEWSSEYLDSRAVGWDWIGINLDDGGALMAFRIRDAAGEVRWAGGSLRGSDGTVQILDRDSIDMTPQRQWRSPRTATLYPVAWAIRAGNRHFTLEPLMDDQENDTRLSTGAIYWEGAVRLLENRKLVGRGYLELTGYGNALKLR